MPKNSKVTSVANPFAQLFASMDSATAASVLALLNGKGVTVKKEAAAKKVSKNPRVIEHLAAAEAGRDAYKAVKAKYKGAKGYFEAAQAAQMAAIEEFYA